MAKMLKAAMVLLALQCAGAVVTSSDLQRIKCAVFNLIDNFPGPGPQPLLAKIVRLSFHDCIGGCDGAVDLSVHGNEGLDIPINQLQSIYTSQFSQTMSRADFWAAAGTMAILKGAFNAGTPQQLLANLKFYSGPPVLSRACPTPTEGSRPCCHSSAQPLAWVRWTAWP